MKLSHIKAHIAAFLTILMVGYFASITLCLHTHEVDGVVVMHSHPYQSSSHTHSNAQINLFSHLNNFESFISHDIIVKTPDLLVVGERIEFNSYGVFSICVEYSSLRAPPAI